jgi:hypothetical protein
MKALLFLLLLPVLILAQTPNDSLLLHLREIPKHNFSIDLGIAEPSGDYGNIARSGLTAAVVYDLYVRKNVGVSTALRHTYNETAFEPFRNSQPQNESLTSLSIGPIFSFTFNRFQLDGFARIGLGFIDTNIGEFTSLNNGEYYNVDNNANKTTSVAVDAGLRFNYFFRRSVQIYFSPQYQATLGDALNYRITQPEVTPVNFDDTYGFDYSNLLFTLGVKFAIGRKYTSGELRNDGEPVN